MQDEKRVSEMRARRNARDEKSKRTIVAKGEDMSILVTGGAGYIGSHTVVELLENDYDVVVVDNLSNSNATAMRRVQEITHRNFHFYQADVQDRVALENVFLQEDIEAVIHFAGYKAVGESVKKPIMYYSNNLESTLVLLETMRRHNVQKFIFSSSATVYGDPASVPITEEFPLFATNPYGRTKLMQEDILRDLPVSESNWKIILLRYFNPVGAHESGLIGEDPKGIPNNLMPFISQVAIGRRDKLSIFGNDYDTPDGTGVRDYIHVVDLAKGHVAALKKLEEMPSGCDAINLGTGEGYSVLDIVKAFEKASNKEIPYEIVDRRPGDIAICYADTKKAKEVLSWEAKYGIDKMCEDTWRWQEKNPNGYEE